ncbi:hypothetical protein BCR34DRAFT_120204 [Clohesyomyces aquaticus]|uniref:Uncharacterized protein n=1 Tax=Clohesyomyces aquaticus TaxID=1231657 RepID=A0A1Y2A170_9PLEO|nr:hypothetical protein BCR34DRAFT_120204 [Clohesyomyces aquaticus]
MRWAGPSILRESRGTGACADSGGAPTREGRNGERGRSTTAQRAAGAGHNSSLRCGRIWSWARAATFGRRRGVADDDAQAGSRFCQGVLRDGDTARGDTALLAATGVWSGQ